jgi:transcriptional regulator GlxA family with amidase domain
VRIEKSKKDCWCWKTALSLASIANQCGFKDQAISQRYKKEVGLSPSARTNYYGEKGE